MLNNVTLSRNNFEHFPTGPPKQFAAVQVRVSIITLDSSENDLSEMFAVLSFLLRDNFNFLWYAIRRGCSHLSVHVCQGSWCEANRSGRVEKGVLGEKKKHSFF